MLTLQGLTLLDKDPLYRGGFTDIYHALYRGEEVGLKRLRLFHIRREKDQQHLRRRLKREATVWQKLKHSHVLAFLGIDTQTFPSDVCVVSPWMRHGTILQYRKARGAANINIERRLLEIAMGMDYLHSEGVVHGDLRGTNILINSVGSACLADFGLTDFVEGMGETSNSHYQGSTRWLAPELIHPDGFGLATFTKTRATDIYAYAYLCLEIFTGGLPFIDIANDVEVIYRVIQGVRPTRPSRYNDPGVAISDDAWDLIERCWDPQPTERMSSSGILRTMQEWNRGWEDSTRHLVESTVSKWLSDDQEYHLCWIENSGDANPTFVARCIAELCAKEGRLAASIFFVNNKPNTINFFQKVADQIVNNLPACQPLISRLLLEEPLLLTPSSTDELQELLMKLFVYPMAVLSKASAPKVIVIDQLELCDETTEMGRMWLTVEILVQALVWLTEHLHRNQLPLRIFMTSLPQLHRKAKRGIPKFQGHVKSLYLHPDGLLDSCLDSWEELRRLTAIDTGYDINTPDSAVAGVPETIIRHITEWSDGDEDHLVCWVKYPSQRYGRRSELADLFAGGCARRGVLAGSLFCSVTSLTSTNFLPTLVYQLGQAIPWLRLSVQQIIEDQRELLLHPSDFACARKLLIEPFLTRDGAMPPMVLVLDCIGWSHGDFLLAAIVWLEQAFRTHNIPIHLFITSEPALYSQANLEHPQFLDAALTFHLPRFETWMVPKSSVSAQTLFTNLGQRIYQTTISFLAVRLSSHHATNEKLCREFQDLLDHIAAMETLEALTRSHECRIKLLQISTDLQLSGHQATRDALEQDEVALAAMLEGILNSDSETREVLALRNDSAHAFLNLLQMIMSKGLLGSHEVARKARKLLVKLSEASEFIPPSVAIRGLTLLDSEPVSGGGFADIYRALYRGQEVALKRLRVRQDQDSHKIRRSFGREALAWQHLKHPYVLPFLGIDSEVFPSALCMVSPWMKHGTILDLRAFNGPGSINIEKRIDEIAEGLEYLHGEGVIHGDLRAVNILVDDQWHAVLADFGLITFGDATVAATHTSQGHGATRWMAPELLLPSSFDLERVQKTQASDVYSFACVCLELYTGRVPYHESGEGAVMYQISMGKRPSLQFSATADGIVAMPDHVKEVVEWCWKQQPGERPEIMDVVQIIKTWDFE